MNKKILLTGIILLGLLPKALGAAGNTKLVAATEGRSVYLVWTYSSLFQGYHIYRRQGIGEFRKITARPVVPVTSCRQIRRILSPGTRGEKKLRDMGIDPCTIHEWMNNNPNLAELLRTYAMAYPRIAMVLGLGYMDSRLTPGITYTYAITGVTKRGESGFLDSVTVTVGTPTLPSAPSGVEAYPGDNAVLIRWQPVPNAAGYIVERREGSGSYVRVNSPTIMMTCKTTPFGDTLLDTTKLCFNDYLRWKGEEPDSHLVESLWVKGPFNGVSYTYRVRAINILAQPGSPSMSVTVTPIDSTPPQTPTDISVTAVGESLKVVWEKIETDISGHKEIQGIQGYRLYRYTSAEDTVGTFVAMVSQPGYDTLQVTYIDKTPGLGSPYEDRVYYYRIVTVDNNGNRSAYSAAVSGIIRDTTPPAPPSNLEAKGFTDYIQLRWKPSPTIDAAGYIIYRGICGDTLIKNEIRVHYPLHIIGSIDRRDSTVFEDHGIPEGSPLCYRYAVKAVDKSRNISDTSNTVCEKLRERVAPPAPVIIGLKARNKAVLIQWVSAPVQDLFGFIVERTDSSSTSWTRVSPELHFPEHPTCQDIQMNSIWSKDTVYSFLDTTVESKTVYKYRVRAADFDGNIGKPSAAISTYTFDFTRPRRPRITNITAVPDGLRISWEPSFSSTEHKGFIVFRATSASGPFHQISGLVEGNSFTDKNVARGKRFWYRIQLIDRDGNRSKPSPAQSKTMP